MILVYREELIMTPESEDEEVVDSEGEGSEHGRDEVNVGEDDLGEDDLGEDDLLSPTIMGVQEEELDWSWVDGDSLADTTPLEFTSEFNVCDFPEGDDMELQYFLEFFTPRIIAFIVKQTNTYQEQVYSGEQTHSRRMSNFKPVKDEDILRMVAVRICMGLDQKPTQANYWSANPFYKSDIVPKITTSDRYNEVCRFLHFCNNERQVVGDRLFKIRKIFEMFNERLGLHLNPGRNICIDESLVLYKGNLFCKQYIPSKAAKFGIKLFSVADSGSGYILNVMIYEGKTHKFHDSVKDFGFGGALVLDLAGRYLHCGRCLYVDNYFVNPRMAKQLLTYKTNICGTLKRRLKCNPNFVGRMRKGTVHVFSSNGLMVEQWRDKKEVRMLSSGHPHQMTAVRTRKGTPAVKPETVLSYNKLSRAIDKMDMVTGAHDMNRKSTKWYKKLFFKILEICLYNANIIRSHFHVPITLLEFKEKLVLQIIGKYGEHCVKRGRKPCHPKNSNAPHYPEYIPPNVTANGVKSPSRDCVLCRKNKKRKQTRFMCPHCNVALCRIPCFKDYHK